MYSKVIQSSYLFLPKAEMANIERTKEIFVVARKFGGEPVKLYKETPRWFGIPLHYYKHLDKLSSVVVDRRVDGRDINIKFRGDLWEKQETLIKKFIALISTLHTGFILESPPGSGKTVMAIKMISILSKTTLVVVPRSNLIKQWIKRILQYTDIPRSRIGVAEGGKASFVGKDIVVGLVQTCSKNVLGESFNNRFGVVIFDEVDRSVPPETFSSAVGKFPAKYRIGMSATLERQDGLHVVFEKHIGECFLRSKGSNRMKPKVIVRKYDGNSGYVHPQSPKLQRRGMLISRLSKNVARNNMIARYTAMVYKSGRQCLVLSDRKEQLKELKKILHGRFKIPSREIGFYMRSVNKKVLTDSELEAASACKVLLATYGMLHIGTDIPSLAGLVFATPQSRITQSVGRIEREQEGKLQPIVIDIVDIKHHDAVRWAAQREKFYKTNYLEVTRYR